jgi:hypothetical protein
VTFFVPDKGTAKQFQGTKNVAEKKRTKAQARLRFFVARAADRRRSAYRPVEIAEKLFSTKKHSKICSKIT